jgi:hypothetical protein
MREVLTAARDVAEAAHPSLVGRVTIRRPASSHRAGDGPHGVVTLPDAGPELVGDGGTLRDGLRLQLSIWQTIDGEDPAVLDALRAAFDRKPWRWLGVTELVEQPGDLLQHAVALGYARAVPPSPPPP